MPGHTGSAEENIARRINEHYQLNQHNVLEQRAHPILLKNGKSRKEEKNNMAIKGAKTIAEYAIRKWLEEQNFAMEYFSFSMDGNRAKLADMDGESLVLVYRPESRSVYIEESAGQTGKEGRDI